MSTPGPEVTDEWVTQVEGLLAIHLHEAESLRYMGGLPARESGVDEVLARLAIIRQRLDRVDEIQAEVGRFRTGVRVLLKKASARVDDGWADAVARSGGNRRGFSGEIEGPRERYARADVAVLGDRIMARRRERVMDAVEDGYRAVDRVRRGLDSVRLDLHALLRLMSAPEHRLDRTDA